MDVAVKFLITVIEERMERYGIVKEGVTNLPMILGSLCHKDSPDYYECYVAKLVPEIPHEGIQLKRLREADLDKVWLTMSNIWPTDPIPVFGSSLCEYVSCKETSEKRTLTHMEIVKNLFNMQNFELETISKLLSLSYWAFSFFCRKECDKMHKGSYKKASHYFMSDLFVTFLALKCRKWSDLPFTSYDMSTIPTLKETLLHTGISPEDSVFQKLVLKEATQILCINSQPEAPVQDLAEDIRRQFSEEPRKGKDAKRVLQIVKDQARYMSLRSPDLRRNFVADKTRRRLSSVAKLLQDNHVKMQSLIEFNNQHKAFQIFREIMDKITELDDGSCMPVLPPAGKSLRRHLDRLHHLILVDIGCNFLREQCPNVKSNWWFKVNDFLEFLRCFAQKVFQDAVTIIKRTAERQNVYQMLADLAVSLQYMIVLRWYISETVQGFQISVKDELGKHQKVIFIMLAFRMLLLFLLPQNTNPYGLQAVAPNLPEYAKNLRIHLHLPVL